jgi:hypothetical protein
MIIVVPLFVLYVVFSDHIPLSYKAPVGIAAMVMVLVAVQIPFSSLRRNAQMMSAANGLSCPECQAPLGGNYFALKRTGKCQRCGAKMIDAV